MFCVLVAAKLHIFSDMSKYILAIVEPADTKSTGCDIDVRVQIE